MKTSSKIRKGLNVKASFKDGIRILFSQGGILFEGLLIILATTSLTSYVYNYYAPWLFFQKSFRDISWTCGASLALALASLLSNYLLIISTVVTAVKNHKTPHKLEHNEQRKEVWKSIQLLLPKGIQTTLACWLSLFLVKYSLVFLTEQFPTYTWVSPSMKTFSLLFFPYFVGDHMRSYHWILYQYHKATPDNKKEVWKKSQVMLASQRGWLTNSRMVLALPLILIPVMCWALSYELEMPLALLFSDWKVKSLLLILFQVCFLFFMMMRLLFYLDLEKQWLDAQEINPLATQTKQVAQDGDKKPEK
ncbi:MAG: hypothetical protein ACPGC9_00450 [Cytophagales bacterium]